MTASESDAQGRWVARARPTRYGPFTPASFLRTRWMPLLVGQPLGMQIVMTAVWSADLRTGFALVTRRIFGQVVVGFAGAAIVAGPWRAGVRVVGSGAQAFSGGADRDLAVGNFSTS